MHTSGNKISTRRNPYITYMLIKTYFRQLKGLVYDMKINTKGWENQELLCNNLIFVYLMGLNKCYDALRSQILVLDPLPIVSKAYSMVLRIEKQSAIQNDLT